MPTTDAQGRTISDDGQWWWDGSAWQPIKKSFFDTLADSVEGAVKKVEGSQGANPPSMAQPTTSAPTADAPATEAPAPAPAPVAAAPAPAPVPPAIPAADLLAYLGALKSAGVVTDNEFEAIRKRIPGQA
jgi:hypothetical protein